MIDFPWEEIVLGVKLLLLPPMASIIILDRIASLYFSNLLRVCRPWISQELLLRVPDCYS
jgi:hypothetical protein